MSENSYEVPEGYYYTKDHEWVQKKSDTEAVVGITDYAAKMLHDIVYVTLPKEGEKISKKAVLGQVESVKTVSDIYSPVSGTVLKSNDRLTREPEVVSSSPYKDGWMVQLSVANFDGESKDLLLPEDYKRYISELAQQ
ncbi:MAG: glycine cleavage system protein GcvH [Nitrososphaerales archaeon]